MVSSESKKVIMVVEDNEDNRELIIKILRLRNFEVIGVEDGFQALEVVGKIAPDLILMDISLPGMDGYEVIRRIKATEDLRHIPIIALTAHAMRGDEAKSLAAGCDAHISKPINVREFPQEISRFLHRE